MVDKGSLSAACEALGMEKPGAVAAPAATTAATKGMGALWRSLPGWGRALTIAAPAAAGGAMLAGGDDNRAQLASLLRALSASRRRLAEYEGTPFAPGEQRMFARHGLDPQRLRFLKTLGGFRKGMELESRLLDEALGGQSSPVAPAAEELGQYA